MEEYSWNKTNNILLPASRQPVEAVLFVVGPMLFLPLVAIVVGPVLSPWFMIFAVVHVVFLLLLIAVEIPLPWLGFVIMIQSVVACPYNGTSDDANGSLVVVDVEREIQQLTISHIRYAREWAIILLLR